MEEEREINVTIEIVKISPEDSHLPYFTDPLTGQRIHYFIDPERSKK